ncbi:MAG: BON domain-containing protein [Methylotenera sp.]|uniref:BON domain-containing protein n=1 Tax=Methylotenera sp. TaxID=2051956 RepID=UPI0024874E73|nr:BON domain-containing protein [Methylotenera sp.]MDI1309855.1 BON domain-containing protein [Methylotenera sp.]
MNTKNLAVITLSVAFTLGLSACDKPEAYDEAGNKVDQSSQRIGDRMGDQATEADTAITDATLTTKVKTDLLTEAGLKSSDISVNTLDGVVTLTGTTDTQENSDRAKQIASEVTGVKNVLNQLTLKP